MEVKDEKEKTMYSLAEVYRKDLEFLESWNPTVIVQEDIEDLQKIVNKYRIKIKDKNNKKIRAIVDKNNFNDLYGFLMGVVMQSLEEFVKGDVMAVESETSPERLANFSEKKKGKREDFI